MAKEHRAEIIAAQTINNNQTIAIEVIYYEKGKRDEILDRSIENIDVDDFKPQELVRTIRDKVKQMNKRSSDSDTIISQLIGVKIDGDGIINNNPNNAGGGK